MIIDRLYESVEKNGHVCVGLDTDLNYLPKALLNKCINEEDALFEFNRRIIDATMDIAACFKVQIAYYEALGLKGLSAYKRTLEYLRLKNCITIADIKRGDIAKTAEMYARAHFEGDFECDMVTLSPYMGMDSIEPYLPYVKNRGKGMFVLVRTSNKGAQDIQYIEAKDGRKLYRHTADKLCALGKDYIGEHGYSAIGGVIGCTHIEEGRQLREDYRNMFLLIPGYGAQGGAAREVAVYLKNGNGGVVNSSRAILLAYRNKDNGEKQFEQYSRQEALRMREEIINEAGVHNR